MIPRQSRSQKACHSAPVERCPRLVCYLCPYRTTVRFPHRRVPRTSTKMVPGLELERGRLSLQQKLGDLDCVKGCSLSEVVADDEAGISPARHTVVSRRIRPTRTSSSPTASRGVGKSKRRMPGASSSSLPASSGESGASVSTQTASACPTRTGNRTHVSADGQGRQLEDLARLGAQLCRLHSDGTSARCSCGDEIRPS